MPKNFILRYLFIVFIGFVILGSIAGFVIGLNWFHDFVEPYLGDTGSVVATLGALIFLWAIPGVFIYKDSD